MVSVFLNKKEHKLTKTTTHQSNKRIYQFDILKGIMIYAVVCIHTIGHYDYYQTSTYIQMDILNRLLGFCVPMFLMLGGYFFSKKVTNLNVIDSKLILNMLKSSVKRILLPYYILLVGCIIKEVIKHHNVIPNLASYLFLINTLGHGLYFLVIYFFGILFFLGAMWIGVQFRLGIHTTLLLVPIFSMPLFILNTLFINYQNINPILCNLPLVAFFCFGSYAQSLTAQFSRYSQKTFLLIATILFSLIFTISLYFLRFSLGHFRIIASSPPTVFLLVYTFALFLILLRALESNALSAMLGKIGFRAAGEQSLFVFGIHPYILIPIGIITSVLDIPQGPWWNPLIILTLSYINVQISLGTYYFMPSIIKKIFGAPSRIRVLSAN